MKLIQVTWIVIHLAPTYGGGSYLRSIVKGKKFNLKQLKPKFNRLCAIRCEFFYLLKHNGFGWDIETNMVCALEETWKNYIKVKTTSKLITFLI